MKALITGCGGFVGSHLAEYLYANTDWDIWGMLRWSDPTDNLINLAPLANDGDRVQFIYGDLRDSWSMRDIVRIVRPDYVFHLAAQSYPLTSFTAANDTFETNIQGTVNLLEACKDHAREALIHICSSSEVYGRAVETPITENTPFNPASPYGISKVGTDQLGTLYAEAYQMRVIVTRMFTHTGARRGDVFAESSFAKQIAMIEACQMNEPILVGNLRSIRTVSDVRDAVKAYYMLLTVNPMPGQVYNIAGDHQCTVRDILSELNTENYAYETDLARMRPIDADNQIADCSKFKKHTGWKPEIPFKETMQWLLSYWRHRVANGEYLIR